MALSRRAAAGAVAALCVTCQAQVRPPASHADPDPVAQADPAPPPAPPFDPDVARPDPTGPVAQARALLEAGDPPAALALALGAVPDAEPGDQGALFWLAARAAERAGQTDRAARSYAAVDDAHALAPWARLSGAQLVLASDPAAALAAAAPLSERDWAGRDQAQAVAALARAGAGDNGAEASLRAALTTATGSARAELERALAEQLAQKDEESAAIEAISLLYAIDARAPGSSRAREALARASEILATLPAARRPQAAAPSLEQAVTRAESLASALEYDAAERAFADLALRLPEATEHARRCEIRLGQGRMMYRRRARREAAALLSRVADECRDLPDVRAWSRWYAAKSYSGRQEMREALAQYDVLAEEQPGHRLADDARVTAARIAQEAGDPDGARTRLREVVDTMPDADLRGEARFLLAWTARSEGDLAGALGELESSIAEGAGETAEDLRGRARYWRGRTLEDLGRTDEAITQYAELAGDLPLSYYAQHALDRLEGLDADRARQAQPPAATEVPALQFDAASVSSEGAARAIALLQVGEAALAERELVALGLEGEDATDDALWLAAALLDRGGAHSRACELSRRRLRARLFETAPAGRALALWRIAYPRAYHPLIEGAATEAGIPASFVRAIAREESSFRPDVVSVAHAYGLLQIIRPTAQRIAGPLGLPTDATSLRRPEINVRIGARYMAGLRQRYAGNPALVPAAYNAGEGAVDRWLRERQGRALDEFVEEIPYEETRRYTRRVLGSWAAYAWLDEGTRPAWPRDLPVR